VWVIAKNLPGNFSITIAPILNWFKQRRIKMSTLDLFFVPKIHTSGFMLIIFASYVNFI